MQKQYKIIHGVFSLCVALITPAAYANSIYSASITNPDNTLIGPAYNDTGASGASVAGYVMGNSSGNISAYSTATASGTTISLSGETRTNPAVTIPAGGSAIGSISFTDLTFSAIGGGNGSLDVSANLLAFMDISVLYAQAGPLGAPFISQDTRVWMSITATSGVANGHAGGNNLLAAALFSGIGGTNPMSSSDSTALTTNTVSLLLNTPYTLTYSYTMDNYRTGIYAEALFQTSLGLSSTPFNLDSGFTADSFEAGIANNTLSTVPVPAAVWLFGSGLIGLLGCRFRST